ncbi:MAG TPA: aminotransferase, partial [Novosphingobium sp.]|nr:aminotransferase [Novosphingobium sp.]
MKRRDLLAAAAAAPVAGILPQAAAAGETGEAYWDRIAALYDRSPGLIQLEHGNWGAMARPVRQ